MVPELMTPEDTGGKLHTPLTTLQWWRSTGRGPTYVKIGRRVFYRTSDLDAFIAAGERMPAKA